jgi:hypothetical protein
MVEFTFGEIEAVLARLYEIAEHKRTAFAGRLKFLQKNGVPMREASGRGKAGAFTFPHLLQICIATELLQCGLTPQRAAKLVQRNWWMKADEILSVLLALDEIKEESAASASPRPTPWVWSIETEALKELSRPTRRISGFDEIQAVQAKDLDNFIVWDATRPELKPVRVILVNAAAFVTKIVHLIVDEFGFAEHHELIRDLDAIEPRMAEAATRFHRTVKDAKDYRTDEDFRGRLEQKFSVLSKQGAIDSGEVRASARELMAALKPRAANFLHFLAVRGWMEPYIPALFFDDDLAPVRDELVRFSIIECEANTSDYKGPVFVLTSIGAALLKLFCEMWHDEEAPNVYTKA